MQPRRKPIFGLLGFSHSETGVSGWISRRMQSDSKGPQQLQFGMRLSFWERTKETWDFLFGWNTPALRFGYMNPNRSSHFRWFYFYTPLVWAYLLGLRQS